MNLNRPGKVFGRNYFPITTLLVFAILLLGSTTQVQAQNFGWSYPQTIPSFDLNFTPPILVADRNRTVHAFSSQFIGIQGGGSVRVVVYNKWTLEMGWTPPIDILLSPIKEARVTDAYLDDEGNMHIVFWGGDGTNADIYYSKAPLAEVGNARAWSKPFIIGDKAGDPESAVFAQNDQGKLIVIFTGRQYGSGLYVVSSDDRGTSWSFPIPIYIASSEAPNLFNLHVIKSESGWLHAIWNMYSVDGQGRAIYYARSRNGEEWGEPTLMVSAEGGLGTQTPTIIENKKTLFALFNLPPKIVMQRSLDNGETWMDPVILFSRHIGVNGSLAPVIDSNNDLHLFFGQRISGNPDIHGMWHSMWVNNRWKEPEAVIKGPAISDPLGITSFDPHTAEAVISQGNVILVTWRTDPGIKGNGVWFSYEILDATEYPISQPRGGAVDGMGIASTPIDGLGLQNNLETESPDEKNSLLDDNSIGSGVWNSGTVIFFAVIPALLLILINTVIRYIRTKS